MPTLSHLFFVYSAAQYYGTAKLKPSCLYKMEYFSFVPMHPYLPSSEWYVDHSFLSSKHSTILLCSERWTIRSTSRYVPTYLPPSAVGDAGCRMYLWDHPQHSLLLFYCFSHPACLLKHQNFRTLSYFARGLFWGDKERGVKKD